MSGIATEERGRVLDDEVQLLIPGLDAAVACVGIEDGKYSEATSVPRGMAFGRACGSVATTSLKGQSR